MGEQRGRGISKPVAELEDGDVVATDFGLHALGGGPDSRTLPNAQDAVEVERIVADAIPFARGDVDTRPGLLDAAVEHLRRLARAQ